MAANNKTALFGNLIKLPAAGAQPTYRIRDHVEGFGRGEGKRAAK